MLTFTRGWVDTGVAAKDMNDIRHQRFYDQSA